MTATVEETKGAAAAGGRSGGAVLGRAECGAGRVHRDVATADDDHALADLRAAHDASSASWRSGASR